MTVATRPAVSSALPAIPMGDIAPWAILASLLAVLVVYFVGAEQGAWSVIAGTDVHEFVHDARHLLGFPCH
ncbi:CbtB domain-containing protein [Tropicibacter naphthalenivorans]|uniref:Cobalt transporter subunit CbtB (Proposed) n=1 Tax=Tropicibacter naphthalenivorans TaxID=441103 RepID=A0A0P1GIN2_9RHOB|nr:CbtB-domain containing protein [Tropicibacter naphthalenivorans]CUH81904.1 hypothetical protein TRN7648_03708 [Tropicibacter naphthalenivorans]SMD02356.1 Probable cobalt transporter subunit (CbtB) [Tropicibacter naphthalenivorans]